RTVTGVQTCALPILTIVIKKNRASKLRRNSKDREEACRCVHSVDMLRVTGTADTAQGEVVKVIGSRFTENVVMPGQIGVVRRRYIRMAQLRGGKFVVDVNQAIRFPIRERLEKHIV